MVIKYVSWKPFQEEVHIKTPLKFHLISMLDMDHIRKSLFIPTKGLYLNKNYSQSDQINSFIDQQVEEADHAHHALKYT